jgi:proliferating cell nuclear antigen PCNA
MKIIINDSSKFEKLNIMMRVLKQFTNEVIIRCDKEKMYIQAMDNAKISIAEYSLCYNWFDTYNVTNDEIFAINTHIFCAVLGCYIVNGKMVIELNDNKLKISYFTNDKEAIITEKNFTIPLVDVNSDLIIIPDIEYEADLDMYLSLFTNMISEISTFSNDIIFSITEESIIFTTNEQYKNIETIDCAFSINLDIEKVNEFSINEDCNIKVCYTTKYLHLISQFSKIFKNIKLSISQKHPLKIEFYEEDNLIIKFYFAPKINDFE